MKWGSKSRFIQWLNRPVHVGAALAKGAATVWKALEWLYTDEHWKVIKRLLATIGIVFIFLAIRYGWMVNDKLDWLIKLFEPILGVKYGGISW